MRRALPSEDLDFVLSRSAGVWQAFHGTRWFITGGTGFVGAWLLEVIQRANDRLGANIDVVVLSRAPQKALASAPHLFGSSSRISLMGGDVLDFDQRLGCVDVCVHAATDVSDPAKAADHRRLFDAGILGTRRVLDAAVAAGAKRFLLTSSGAVYGVQPPELELIPESYNGAPDCLDARTAYGQSKRVAEWLSSLYAASGDLDVAIARIFALVGPGMPLDGPLAAGNFIRDALRGQPIQVRDGRPIRSYLYAADMCVWLLSMLSSGANGRAYNLGSEHPVSISQLARIIARLCNRQPPSECERELEVASPPRYVPNTSKARLELGVAEYTSFETALMKTINWSRSAVLA